MSFLCSYGPPGWSKVLNMFRAAGFLLWPLHHPSSCIPIIFQFLVGVFFFTLFFYLHRIVFLHFKGCFLPEVWPLVSFPADLDAVPLPFAPLALSPYLLLSRIMLLGTSHVTSNKHHLMNESSLYFIPTSEKFTIREFLLLPLDENTGRPSDSCHPS